MASMGQAGTIAIVSGAVAQAGMGLTGSYLQARAQRDAAKTAARAAVQQQQIIAGTELGLARETRATLVQFAPVMLGGLAILALAFVIVRGGR